MGYWSALRDAVFGRKSSGMSPDAWWNEYGRQGVSSAGVRVSQLTALQVSTVQACVSIRAEDVAKLPVHVFRKKPDGGREIVKDHPLERVLQHPNDFQTRFEFIEQMQVAILLRGNAYAAILRDGRGRLTGLVAINPDRVSLYESPGGQVFYNVARRGLHEMAMLASLPLMIPADDMLQLRWMALDNSLLGANRIALAREAIGLALSQQELASRLSANNTNLGGVLTTEQKLSQEAASRLREDWKQRHEGYHNAGGTAVLEQGLKWQALGTSARDAEVNASRATQVQEIARLYRMPLHKLGVPEANNASVQQMDQEYINGVVTGDLGRWEAKLDHAFGLSEEGLFVQFDTSVLLRASQTERYNAYRTGIVGMFMTPNQARRAEAEWGAGWEDQPEGDTLYQPTNVAPIGFEPIGFEPAGNETGPGSDVTGAPAAGGHGDPAAVDDTKPKD